MLPAAIVDSTLDSCVPLLDADDAVIDGGNSYYRDDIARAKALAGQRASTTSTAGRAVASGALDRGYCLMIGGEDAVVAAARPDLQDDRPRRSASAEPTPSRGRTRRHRP